MAHWRSVSSVPGFPLRYRLGRKLVGDRTTKSRLEHLDVTESQFADDAALYTTSHENLCTIANEFISCASDWGLTVSITKTKAMSVGPGRVCVQISLSSVVMTSPVARIISPALEATAVGMVSWIMKSHPVWQRHHVRLAA